VLARITLATLRVLADSERTDEIHVVEELTGQRAFAGYLAREREQPELRALLADRPELSSEAIDFDALRRLPAGSLGRAYVDHLDDNGLTADSQATQTRYVDDPDVAYLIRRFRQTHDVWHALTGLGTTGHEEVVIHAFSWGQLGLPVSKMVVVFGSLKHLVLERRWRLLRHGMLDAYRSGRDAAPLLPVYWERAWDEPLAEVRRRYNVRPCPVA
jgi:ubiquinone biosynthesis protein COQ4